MQLIYEVAVTIDAIGRPVAEAYMPEHHIPDVISHPAFSKANFHVVQDPEQGKFSFVTHYYITDEAAFKRYVAQDSAPRKADFAKKLGPYNPQVVRRVLELK